MPEISQDYINRRRQRLRSMTSTPLRTAPRRSRPTRTTTRPTPSRPSITSTTSRPAPSRTRPTPSRTRPTPSRPKTTKTISRPAAPSRAKTTGSVLFEKYKPKAGILSLEDFKCIFCFQLPKLPADNHRGIVLCPNCRHPAHADEFKEWTQDSPLCSRCDAPIPPSFRRNPVIISAKQYTEVIDEYKRRKT
ncbi:MAG: hypothetical protein ACFE8P_16135 [Promethearchaeota archaeon]